MKLNESYKNLGIYDSNDDTGDVRVFLWSAIPRIEKTRNGKTIKVIFHPDIIDNPSTNYIFEDEKIVEIIKKCEEENLPIIAQVEKHRRNKDDKDIPIAELSSDIKIAKEKIVSTLVGVYNINQKKWYYTSSCKVDLNELKLNSVNDFIKKAQMTEDDPDLDSFFIQPEKKVYIPNPTNFDYQQQLFTMYYFVRNKERKYDFSLKDETRKKIASILLKSCDHVQKKLKKADFVDYKDYAHTRARFMMFQYEEEFENLDYEKIKSITDWSKGFIEHCNNLIEWSENE